MPSMHLLIGFVFSQPQQHVGVLFGTYLRRSLDVTSRQVWRRNVEEFDAVRKLVGWHTLARC